MDKQSRKWQLTINNPQDRGIDHDSIKKALEQFKGRVYWCMADEVGLGTQTPHIHIFLCLKSRVQFSTVKKRFGDAYHIEAAGGTPQENRDYITKGGKWAADPKADTSVPGTFEEWGVMPDEPGQGARTDIARIYQQIDDAMTNAEIMAANPDSARYINLMDRVRQELLEDQHGKESVLASYQSGYRVSGDRATDRARQRHGLHCHLDLLGERHGNSR